MVHAKGIDIRDEGRFPDAKANPQSSATIDDGTQGQRSHRNLNISAMSIHKRMFPTFGN